MKFFSIPSPQDWLKTLWLIPTCTLWSMVGGGLNELLLQVNEDTPVPPSLLIASSIFSILIFPIFSTAFIHHLLWGKSKNPFLSWLPKRESWSQAFWLWLAAILGILVFSMIIFAIALFYIAFVYLIGGLINSSQSELTARSADIVLDTMENEQYSQPTMWFGIGFWIYCAAIVFRCQRLRKNKAPKEGA